MDESKVKSPVESKRDRLSEFFAPDVIVWNCPGLIYTPVGAMAVCTPTVHAQAIRDRLDDVLGVDSWRERYQTHTDYVTCSLECRFEAGGEWVSRFGVSNRKEPHESHYEALRVAACSLRVGRYLVHQVQSVKVVEDKDSTFLPKKLERTPVLPQHLLPHEWRYVERETARKLRSLVTQACEESGNKGRPLLAHLAVRDLVDEYGIKPDAQGQVNLATLLNRQCTASMQRVHAWIADIAAGQTYTPNCPVSGNPPANHKQPERVS